MAEAAPAAAAPRRFAALDAARGISLCAMVVFHFAFDLETLGLAHVGVEGFGWRLFAKLIAGSFLLLSGISLVIAQGNGWRTGPYLRRLGVLVAAALGVTLATWYAMPEQFIFFGILHSIAVASLVGLLFLKAPAPLTLAAAILAFVLPWLIASPIFDAPALVWIGLGTQLPSTLDFEPVFPWLSPFLAGMAAAQLYLRRFAATRLAGWQPKVRPARGLAFAGRHSLAVYLVHQPLMFGALSLLALALSGGPDSAAQDRPFLENCQAVCIGRGRTKPDCTAYCACTAGELKKAGLWDAVLHDSLTAAERERLPAAMQVCARAR
jgi:uncharacterized membrane protein